MGLNDRPQDVGRKHKALAPRGTRNQPRRLGKLLTTYQTQMRQELYDLLRELTGDLSVAERERRWKLAIVLARELGAEIEPPRPLDGPRAVPNAPAAVNFD